MKREPAPVPSERDQLRAQLLATEHWSLLATRASTLSEVQGRITAQLMLTSACIISLGLIGQLTGFDDRFVTLALVLVAMLLLTGTLTLLRLGNASVEDMAHVIGMNRIRAAYLELDPGMRPYLVTSGHDDSAGIRTTYNPLLPPSRFQPFATGTAFLMFLNSFIAGAFAGLAAVALEASGLLVAGAAIFGAGAYFGSSSRAARGRFEAALKDYEPRFEGEARR